MMKLRISTLTIYRIIFAFIKNKYTIFYVRMYPYMEHIKRHIMRELKIQYIIIRNKIFRSRIGASYHYYYY